MSSLGALLCATGRLDEAGPLYQAAVRLRRRGLGLLHPATLTSVRPKITRTPRPSAPAPFDTCPTGGTKRPSMYVMLVQWGYKSDHLCMQCSSKKERADSQTSNLGVLLQAQGKFGEAERRYTDCLCVAP